MQRVIVQALGGPEQLLLESGPEVRQPVAGEVLVDVEAAGVNFLDINLRKGAGVHAMPAPFTPGLEGVGRIRAVGVGVSLIVGQRVAWINVRGSYATQLVMKADLVVPVPDSLAISQVLLFQAMTAQYLATEYGPIEPGDHVLVHAAAGGVGQLLVQWLKHLGAWVVGTTSSEEKAEVARAAGADVVINYGRDYRFLDELMRLTHGRGVDLAFDSVGAATFANTVKGLARGGMAVCCGVSSGPAPAISPAELTTRCTRIAAGSLFSYIVEPGEFQLRAASVIEGIEAGWLRMPEATAYPMASAADAHRAIESRLTHGKLYLVP
ncbi:zinc-binding dehydrogenase [Aromatoleum toluvorans]|uniref:Zinc-binding dehydrogenase n=1 Tax=Aromatoleum toluvorans TaxID=92002 RepID=A0ABX1Q5G4_9RHOO|nr:quinone oxidoreductase [Aromatoleum toluvorans]NMG46125.1 zinc-binding dehydrogenase [Aromatoleum toluvorans]